MSAPIRCPVAVIVSRGLLDGLGVEDIAVKSGISVDRIRRQVALLRSKGQIARIVAQARQRKG